MEHPCPRSATSCLHRLGHGQSGGISLWELAEVAWLNAQLHDDDVANLNGLPDEAARMRQSALILDGYRLEPADRVGFVDRMIEFAIRSARDEAEVHHVTPDQTSPAPDGFPTLWAIAWRSRAAAWISTTAHRSSAQSTTDQLQPCVQPWTGRDPYPARPMKAHRTADRARDHAQKRSRCSVRTFGRPHTGTSGRGRLAD